MYFYIFTNFGNIKFNVNVNQKTLKQNINTLHKAIAERRATYF